jgi:hypothetical protein
MKATARGSTMRSEGVWGMNSQVPKPIFRMAPKKIRRTLWSNLMGLVASLQNLQQNYIIDPSNVMGTLRKARR